MESGIPGPRNFPFCVYIPYPVTTHLQSSGMKPLYASPRACSSRSTNSWACHPAARPRAAFYPLAAHTRHPNRRRVPASLGTLALGSRRPHESQILREDRPQKVVTDLDGDAGVGTRHCRRRWGGGLE
jgi:hypothetical protein